MRSKAASFRLVRSLIGLRIERTALRAFV